MKIKEIHDLLLSLLLRGLGIWLLYVALTERFIGVLDSFYGSFVRPDYRFEFESLLLFLAQIVVAGYFIMGAPPFLKWATRDKGLKE